MDTPASPWKKIDRSRDREIKREAVIGAGAAAFNARGYHNASLDEIAARLEISKPTLYYYVKSKEEILVEIFRIGLERLEAAAHQAQATGGLARAKLEVLVVGYVALMTTEIGRCIIRVSDVELSVAARDDIRGMKRATQKHIEAILEEGLADGSLAMADVRLSAFALAGAMNGVALWYDASKAETAETIAAGFLGVFGAGLNAR